MSDQDEIAANGSGLQVLKILWLAFLFALVIYALLPPLLKLPEEGLDARLQTIVFVVLAVAAVSVIAVLVVIRRMMPSATDPDSPELRRRTLLVSLISWSLAETVALFGVVLYVLSHEPLHLYPFLVVAFGLLLLLAPRESRSAGPSSRLARPDIKIG
jgi:hypothetical protein